MQILTNENRKLQSSYNGKVIYKDFYNFNKFAYIYYIT